ncbi:diaminopimelate decarboxylase [Thermospira aquatica]|uniref:Diaminopimelate decarboxylase n=1 Tax=Thermospira aquatica TaxID=2828656 RepID=A0AAX3BCP3_9SPIR|nr:diaminopimelate decarboxylase [Thermospira aquatica]URA09926.1 diaminopimelate decarboxylase [Thermospira aquatica]
MIQPYQIENNQLTIGGVKVCELIGEFGSPLYVYHADVIRDRYNTLFHAIPYPHKRIHYAMKANSNLRILKMLLEMGACIDAVSLNEVRLALHAGFPAERILFTGINTKTEELHWLVSQNIRVNIGSLHMLQKYASLFPGSEVSIRINPDFGGGHHSHVITGGRESKFGIFYSQDSHYNQIPQAKNIIENAHLKLVGIHAHIGSGILEEGKFIDLVSLILSIAKQFPDLEFVDFGGGFGIPYRPEEKPFQFDLFADHLKNTMEKFTREYGKEITIAFEPGRFIVAEAGILLTTVTDIKHTPKYTFVGVDSGFNHLIRPMAYGSYHPIFNAFRVQGEQQEVVIAGYLCESGDLFTRDENGPKTRLITTPLEGDVLAILNAGAYGFSMSSNYNMHPRPAEVLIENNTARLIRRRETFEDMIRFFV